MRKAIVVAGVLLDTGDMPEIIDRIEDLVASGRLTGRTHQVATVNTQFVVNASSDPTLRGILQRVDLGTVDGAPLVWAARLLGAPSCKRVPGADLVPELAKRAADRGLSLFLFGARPDVARRAADMLKERHPGLRIAGVLSPPEVSADQVDPEIVACIREANPDILLVALGNPKQEKWIAAYAGHLRGPVCIGVGGTFDFLAGTIRRAPAWVQASGFEWLFRLAQEPRRLLGRYTRAAIFFPSVFLYQVSLLLRCKLALHRAGFVAGSRAGPNMLTRQNIEEFCLKVEDAMRDNVSVIIDLSQFSYVDSTGLGRLVVLCTRAKEAGKEVCFRAVSPELAKLFAFSGLGECLAGGEERQPSTVVQPSDSLAGVRDDLAVR